MMVLALALGLGSLTWSWIGGEGPVVALPPLQIEVLNGCGEPGLAQMVAERLQGLGHDVVRVADATDHGLQRTVVVDRRGRDRLSRELARRIGPCPVVLERVAASEADLTLIVGADWRRLRLFSGDGPV
jgi:hypothetical protein